MQGRQAEPRRGLQFCPEHRRRRRKELWAPSWCAQYPEFPKFSTTLLPKQIQLRMLWLLQKGRRSRCTPSHSLVRKSFLQLQCCRVHAAGAHPRRTRPERRRSSSTPSLSSLETEHNTLRLGSFFLRETCPHISALSQLPCPLAAASTKEKGSRRKSHCWAEPSPCLTSSAQKRSSALCFSRLHRIYHCHLCISKHEASRIVSRGNAGRELSSSTSSR